MENEHYFYIFGKFISKNSEISPESLSKMQLWGPKHHKRVDQWKLEEEAQKKLPKWLRNIKKIKKCVFNNFGK